jgi:large conductance mechanosensitive channel
MAGCRGSSNDAGHPASELWGGFGMNRGLVDEFKAFILRGNVLDLAVAVVIGAAFGAIVTSLVENIVTPIIGAIGGQPDFSALTFTINNSEFRYGAFINSLIAFLIIALVIFFLIIKPMNALMAKVSPPAAEGEPAICPECFSPISPDANRCPNCTTWLRGPNAPVS